MESNRATEIIVTLLQNSLAGQLDCSSHFNPQFVADAIAAKVDFGKSYTKSKNDKIVGVLIDTLVENKNIVNHIIKELTSSEKLLTNFLKGKITAYDEILEILNKL